MSGVDFSVFTYKKKSTNVFHVFFFQILAYFGCLFRTDTKHGGVGDEIP